MSQFKVIEIINGNTVKVSPSWEAVNGETNENLSGEIIKISGFNATEDDEYAKQRLISFLLNKEVELIEPELIERNLPTEPLIKCKVLVQNTNIVYYFPEYKNKEFA